MAKGRSIHDWQSMSHVKKENPYLKQEQFPKQHQKDKQWVQEELPFEDKPWRQKPLTNTEVEELFWGKLVALGWKIHTYDSGGQEKKTIVLPCPQCNRKIDLYTWDWVSKDEANKISTAEYVNQRIKDHEPDCKAIPEEWD
jgi:hypothetical protein